MYDIRHIIHRITYRNVRLHDNVLDVLKKFPWTTKVGYKIEPALAYKYVGSLTRIYSIMYNM